jgi:hypothetical protein
VTLATLSVESRASLLTTAIGTEYPESWRWSRMNASDEDGPGAVAGCVKNYYGGFLALNCCPSLLHTMKHDGM